MINSGVNKEEVLNSFEDLNLQTNQETPDAPKNDEKFEDHWVNLQENLTTRCFTQNQLHMTFPLSR